MFPASRQVGWQFDDGKHTRGCTGVSSIHCGSYVTIIGNGCYEEYPVTHAFPAQAVY